MDWEQFLQGLQARGIQPQGWMQDLAAQRAAGLGLRRQLGVPMAGPQPLAGLRPGMPPGVPGAQPIPGLRLGTPAAPASIPGLSLGQPTNPLAMLRR